MLNEFGVDPSCMPTIDDLRRVVDHCAFHLGRFISEFPQHRWPVDVRQRIKPTTFLAIKQLEDIVSALQRRGGLINTGRAYKGVDSWIENAFREHARRPFRGIVLESNAANDPTVVTVAEITPETRLWNVAHEDRVARTAAELTRCLRPLLHISRHVLFVDHCFEPDTSRYQHALQSYLECAHEGGRKYERLEIHTKLRLKENEPTEEQKRARFEEFKKACYRYLPNCIPAKANLKVIVWEELADSDEMHPRYLMTERGAIRIDKGLDIGKQPNQTTDISIVHPTVYRGRWNDLQPDATTYRRFDTISVVGIRRS